MVSYEKIRQSLRSWTLFIAWVNVLGAVAKVFSIISHFILVNNLDQLKAQLDATSYRNFSACRQCYSLCCCVYRKRSCSCFSI